MAAASLHLCGLRLNAGGYAALLSAVLAVSLGGGPVTMTLAALLLVPVAWTVWQRRSLLHTTLSARA
ncbi:hypothetical protein [Xanthomonas citri]|nr:hypothetical protein [Xanthomonas citri]MCC4629771.1 hypothetical protein [Xanthomonas citri]